MISDKEDTMNIDHIVKTYSPCLPAPVDEFILRGEVYLWRHSRTQAMNPDVAVPGTALEGSVARSSDISVHQFVPDYPLDFAGQHRRCRTKLFLSQESENLAEIANG